METIKERVCITTYKGKCPICETIQTSSCKSSVDTTCVSCRNKEYTNEVKNDLIGAVIKDVICENGDLTEIIVNMPDPSVNIRIVIEQSWDEPSVLSYYDIIDD